VGNIFVRDEDPGYSYYLVQLAVTNNGFLSVGTHAVRPALTSD